MKLEGEIGEIRVIEHLVEMGRERFTGAVRFENDGIIKIIYFKTGDVLSASTNDRADSIDEILLRAGKVTREHVKQALAKRKESETLGDALLNLGFITRKELTWARRAQVIGVIRSIDAWTAGQFTVVADYLPKREEGTLFPLPQIIIELIVTDQERQRYERALDGGNVSFSKAPDFAERFRALGLNEDAEAIAAQIDGTRNAAEIAASSGKDPFNVYKLLHALEVLGMLERPGEPQVKPEFSFDAPEDIGFGSSGVADAADMWGDAVHTEEPPMSLGLDFPSVPAMGDAHVDLAEEPTQEVALPAWDAPGIAEPSIPASATIRASGAPAASAWDEEKPVRGKTPSAAAPAAEQWGFDEAQLETVRRASAKERSTERVPPSMRSIADNAAKPNRWIGVLIGSVVLIAIAFGGLAAWNWWLSRSGSTTNAQVTPVVHRAKRRTPPATTSAATDTTSTLVPLTASGAAATDTRSTTGAPAPVAQTTSIATAPVPAAAAVTPVIAQKSAAAPAAARTTPPAPAQSAGASVPRVERSTAGATITNGGAIPSDPLRAHYDEMARKFAAQPTGNYTVQFELVCESASLTTAVKQGGSNIWFVPFSYRGRPCYRVFWGHYATHEEAAAGQQQIPSGLRGAAPVVVSVPKP